MNLSNRASLTALALSAASASAFAQSGGPYTLTWSTFDGGGAMFSTGGQYTLGGTIGQPDAGNDLGGNYGCAGGFWTQDSSAACYANCDGSTSTPVLNVADFTCFLQKFSTGNAYANCDGSTGAPTLNVADFTCFLQKFAQGCP